MRSAEFMQTNFRDYERAIATRNRAIIEEYAIAPCKSIYDFSIARRRNPL